jgi:hypothetical protein
MILYHFTGFYNLKNVGPKNILTVGLVPGIGSGKQLMPWLGDGAPPNLDVVWFTRNPEPKPMFVIEGGEAWNREIRVTVNIPSTDRRLMNWERWFKKALVNADDIIAAMDKCPFPWKWQEAYVYFGRVSPNKFRAIEYADPEMRAQAQQAIRDGTFDAYQPVDTQ